MQTGSSLSLLFLIAKLGVYCLFSLTEPDQALVVKKDGYCYGVFRGTTLTREDWSQNLVIGKRNICGSDAINPEGEPAVCCTVRTGFYDAYHTIYYQGKRGMREVELVWNIPSVTAVQISKRR